MNVAEIILRQFEDAVFRIALQEVKSEGINTYSFGGLDYLSDKFATVLMSSGISQGEVVAVVLPQSAAFAVAHLAVMKLGAVVLPISTSTEQSLIKRMLEASGAKCLVIDESFQDRIFILSSGIPPRSVLVASELASKNEFAEGYRGFWHEVNYADANFAIVETEAITSAYLFFEPGTDDKMVSSSINHGELIETFNALSLSDSSQDTKVFWTSRDWATRQIIIEMLFKTWLQGNAVASYETVGLADNKMGELFGQLNFIQHPLDIENGTA